MRRVMKELLRTFSIVLFIVFMANLPVRAAQQDAAGVDAGKSEERPLGYILLRAPLHSPLFSNCPAEPAKGKTASEAPPGYVILRVPIGVSRFSDCPVALVNDKPLTVREFSDAIASFHEGMAQGTQATRIDYAQVLKRLIYVRLVLEEAKTIGLDELPEVKEDLKIFSNNMLRDMVSSAQVRNIKVDEAQVQKLYKAFVKEVKVSAVWFHQKKDAKKMEAAAKAGRDFNELVKQLPHGKDTKVLFKDDVYVKDSNLGPAIRGAVSVMKVGEVSPLIPMPGGFGVAKLKDVRFPEDQKALEEARKQVLEGMRFEALEKYKESLEKKYVKLNKKLFDSIDFEAGGVPGFLALLKDKRVLAQIKGYGPVTVGEYANALKDTFFHIEGEIKAKRVNRKKVKIYHDFIDKKLLVIAAREKGLDKTAQFKDAVEEHRDAVLYTVFINKVIAHGTKITNDEMKRYYEEHISEYSSPERIRVSSLIFDKNRRRDAEKAAEELRAGTDINWLKDNAGGQAGKSVTDKEGELPRDIVSLADLPEGVSQALTGSKPGDVKLYENPDGYFYVILVEEVFPPQPVPFASAKEDISKVIFFRKLQTQFDQYAEKLWDAYHVEVFGEELARELEGRAAQK
jgi:hypothetical protein